MTRKGFVFQVGPDSTCTRETFRDRRGKIRDRPNSWLVGSQVTMERPPPRLLSAVYIDYIPLHVFFPRLIDCGLCSID